MTDFLWPPDIIPASQTWGVVDNVGVFSSPLSGSVRTVSRPGARLRCSVTVPPVKSTSEAAERARLIGVLSSLRGRSHRLLLPDFSTTRRGSFVATELLTNNYFANGTTGFTGADATLSVQDRILRATYTGGATECDVYQTSGTVVTQYAPYAVRSFIRNGTWDAANNIGPAFGSGSVEVSDYSTTRGMRSAAHVMLAATANNTYLGVGKFAGAGQVAGTFYEIDWGSLARCILVDNGSNLLLYSDQINNAAWTKSATSAGTNNYTAPDGSATADGVVEDSSTGGHYIVQEAARSSGATDLCAYGYFRRAVGTRNIRLIAGNDGSNYGAAIFDLGGGTYSNITNNGTATNTRAFIVSAGGGWYYCAVVARVPTATTARLYAEIASGTTLSYAGDGASAVAMWRLGITPSAVPTRGVQTTSAAASGASQTGGNLYVKGLPASTLGLLKAGDPVQLGTQMNIVASSLDSDASGRGILMCSLPWRASPSDNDPIHVNTPMARMILASEDISWETGPGQFSSFQLEFVEDVA